VESIAFDRAYGGEGSTKAILLGTDQGQIFETALEYHHSGSGTSSGGGGGGGVSALGVAAAAAAVGGGGGVGGAAGGGKERPVVKVSRQGDTTIDWKESFPFFPCPLCPLSSPLPHTHTHTHHQQHNNPPAQNP
jgi:hypothetical protein